MVEPLGDITRLEQQHIIDPNVVLKAFDPLTTDAERVAFAAKVTRIGPRAQAVQEQRLTWLEEKLAEVHARGDSHPKYMSYETLGDGNLYPMFNEDAEFAMPADAPGTHAVIHLPTGIRGSFKRIIDYRTGRVRFLFQKLERKTEARFDDGSYYLRGELVTESHYRGSQKTTIKDIIEETPLAEYSVVLRKADLPRRFDVAAKTYIYYRNGYNSVQVAEDEHGNPLGFWSETKSRWIKGKPSADWRRGDGMVNFTDARTGKSLHIEEQEMAEYQGLVTGVPSADLVRIIEQATSDEGTTDNKKDPRYSISGIVAHEAAQREQERRHAQEQLRQKAKDDEAIRQQEEQARMAAKGAEIQTQPTVSDDRKKSGIERKPGILKLEEPLEESPLAQALRKAGLVDKGEKD